MEAHTQETHSSQTIAKDFQLYLILQPTIEQSRIHRFLSAPTQPVEVSL